MVIKYSLSLDTPPHTPPMSISPFLWESPTAKFNTTSAGGMLLAAFCVCSPNCTSALSMDMYSRSLSLSLSFSLSPSLVIVLHDVILLHHMSICYCSFSIWPHLHKWTIRFFLHIIIFSVSFNATKTTSANVSTSELWSWLRGAHIVILVMSYTNGCGLFSVKYFVGRGCCPELIPGCYSILEPPPCYVPLVSTIQKYTENVYFMT